MGYEAIMLGTARKIKGFTSHQEGQNQALVSLQLRMVLELLPKDCWADHLTAHPWTRLFGNQKSDPKTNIQQKIIDWKNIERIEVTKLACKNLRIINRSTKILL